MATGCLPTTIPIEESMDECFPDEYPDFSDDVEMVAVTRDLEKRHDVPATVGKRLFVATENHPQGSTTQPTSTRSVSSAAPTTQMATATGMLPVSTPNQTAEPVTVVSKQATPVYPWSTEVLKMLP